MDGEDYRTGSADSENGSDNSYVQVSREDVRESDPLSVEEDELVEDIVGPSGDDSEDIYGDNGEQDETLSKEESVPVDTPPPEAFVGGEYMDSTEEPEPSKPAVVLTPTRVEEVTKPPPTRPPPTYISSTIPVSTSPSTYKSPKAEVPVVKGYLSFLNVLHPLVLYMIYWRDVKLSAVVLCVELVLLFTLTLNTLIHTLVLFLLSFLVVSLTYIVSKVVIDSFYNREVKNPFSDYLNKKIALPEDKIIEWTQYLIGVLNQRFNRLVRLLLFDNIKQSLKFGLTLWLLSFVTNYLSVLCILFSAVVLGFSVPPLYERFQPKIDAHVDRDIKWLKGIFCMIKSKIPYIGKNKSD